ncbi:MAG: hypothetical protein Q7K45_00105 [Nanoarchaeota archaeon]|nr:hypothetical protein [Nanoarchaeota archaeon]
MARKTPEKVAPEISLLLPQLEERGFENVNARDIEEALEMLDYKGVTEEGSDPSFYFSEIKNELPLEVSLIPVQTSDVIEMVAGYLLSNPPTSDAFIDSEKFLPDPLEPNTDLEELAKITAQKAEMRNMSDSIGQLLLQGNITQAREELGTYLSVLEKQMPGLIIPGKESVDHNPTAYVEQLFAGPVAVRGYGALNTFLQDLENIAAESVVNVTTTFIVHAPILYSKLQPEDAQSFVSDGLRELKKYNAADDSHSVLGPVIGYFSLTSDAARQTITDLVVKEHEQLVPWCAQFEERLKHEKELSASAHQDSEKISRRYTQLEQRATEDKSNLEREKLRNELLGEALSTLRREKSQLTDKIEKYNPESYQDYQKASQSLGRSRISSIVGWGAATIFFLIAYTNSDRFDAPVQVKPAPVVTSLSVSDVQEYDPEGKNITQLEKDLYQFVKKQAQAGREIPDLGPGCLNVLHQVYEKMGGVEEGRNHFVNTMLRSAYCSKISPDDIVRLGGK